MIWKVGTIENIIVDEKEYVKDGTLIVDTAKRLTRVWLTFINKEDATYVRQHQIDLALKLESISFSMPKLVITITGREMERDMYMKLHISINVIWKRMTISGEVEGNKVEETTLTSPREILDLIKKHVVLT
jgi:hypothetical protein